MTKNLHLIACCLFSLILSQQANAELSWRDHERSVAAGFGQEQIVEAFHFSNEGRKTTIRKIETSCGCTTAKLDKMTYAPGESGVIRVTLKIGSLTGTQIKTIKVFTDDPGQPEVHLTLKVVIPELLRITPRLVFWRPDEKPEPRTIDVTVVQEQAMKLTGLKTDGEGLRRGKKRMSAGRHSSTAPVRAGPDLQSGRDALTAPVRAGPDLLS